MNKPICTEPVNEIVDRDWYDGLFDCTNDCKSCWLITFFAPCYLCYMYHRYNECVMLPAVMPEGGLVLRAFHRGRERIRGTLLKDCCISTFCCPCALCQLDRDMKYVEESRGYLDV